MGNRLIKGIVFLVLMGFVLYLFFLNSSIEKKIDKYSEEKKFIELVELYSKIDSIQDKAYLLTKTEESYKKYISLNYENSNFDNLESITSKEIEVISMLRELPFKDDSFIFESYDFIERCNNLNTEYNSLNSIEKGKLENLDNLERYEIYIMSRIRNSDHMEIAGKSISEKYTDYYYGELMEYNVFLGEYQPDGINGFIIESKESISRGELDGYFINNGTYSVIHDDGFEATYNKLDYIRQEDINKYLRWENAQFEKESIQRIINSELINWIKLAKNESVSDDFDEKTKDNIKNYVGAWYVTEYGKSEFSDDGYVIQGGTDVEILEISSGRYEICVTSLFSSGAMPSTGYIGIDVKGDVATASYTEDGWGNKGTIKLSFVDEDMYITVDSVGNGEFGIAMDNMHCTKIE